MNYFLLAETEFFRQIREAGDYNMETAYMAFATQVIELCNSMDTSHTVIALAYIEIELQHHPVRLLPEERKEAAAYIGKALSFVRKMQKFLSTTQVPPLSAIRTSHQKQLNFLYHPCNGRAMPSTLWNLSTASMKWAASTMVKCRSNSLLHSCTGYSASKPKTATASTSTSNDERTKAAPTSSIGCKRNSTGRFCTMKSWNR